MTSLKDTCQTLHFLGPALIGAAMYICAVTVYIKRFPENFFPGKFDAAGMASHVYVCLSIFNTENINTDVIQNVRMDLHPDNRIKLNVGLSKDFLRLNNYMNSTHIQANINTLPAIETSHSPSQYH
ncbi:hypothetical protein HPULCUR_009441 [Helicostylum pulchrum]|uniref:Uncharacterized protein n=1 Tax=Helicostylum pulchrum TaxID=562976 RepID=A0ABP9YAG9_9FUNG